MSFQSPSAPICLLVKILSPALISGNLYSCTLRIYPQQINGATDNYTVSNVSPNFWISNYSGGQSWRINSISNVNTELQTLDCVIEDVEYYNYSLDVTIGLHGPSDNINGYCFQIGDNGLPNLVPIYSNTFTISQTFISDLTARFNSRNYSTSYISVLQNGHSFVKGNFIGLNVSTGAYVLATSAITYLEIIGVVTSIGIPTVNHFTFRPFGQYLKASEIPTALTQGVGSLYYLDSSGNLTITNTYDSNPVYIQVSSGGDGILLKYRSPSLRTAYLNNIQGSTATQSVSLFSSSVSPATISIGNTGGDTLTINPPVTSNGSVTLAANKTLTLNSTGGKVLSNVLTGTTTSSAITIGESGDTSTVTINKDAVVATSKSLTCDTFTGNNATTAISLFGTTTASNIALGAGQTTGNITLGHATPASDSGTLTINKTTTFAANKNITLNGTGSLTLSTSGAINCMAYNSTSTAQSITIAGNLDIGTIDIGTAQTTGGIRIGNLTPASDSGTLTINKLVSLPANKTITLNSTGGKVLSNVLTGTTTSSAMTIGESGDTSTVTINKDVVIATSKSLACDTFTGNNATAAISLFGTTTASNIALGAGQTSGNITLGNSTPASDSGTLTINKLVSLPANKTLTLNSTGGKVLTNVLTGTTTSSAMTIGESGDTSTVTINKDAVLASGKTLTLNSTGGKVICNTLEGTAVGSAVSLFGTTTSTIALGNASGGAVTINPAITANGSVTLASGKTITLNSTGGKVLSNVLTGTTTSSAMTIGESGDTSTVTINKDTVLGSGKTITLNSTGGKVLSNVLTGTTTSSAITIGESGDTSTVTINKDAVVATSKSLTCDTFTGNNATTAISLFGTTTASNIALGAGQTSGNITLGHSTPASDSGTLTINKNTVVATSKSLACDTFTGNNATTAISLFGTTTASNIALGAVQTSGNITIGNSTPASDSGTLTINKLVSLPANKTITLNSTGGKVLTNVLTGTSTSSAMTIGESGDTSTVTINKNTVLASGKTLTLNSTGGKILCNSYQATTTSSISELFTDLTGNAIYIGNTSNGNAIELRQPVVISGTRNLSVQAGAFINCNAYRTTTTTSNLTILDNSTSGTFTIGNSTPANDTGTIVLNRSTSLGSNKTLTLNSTGGSVLSPTFNSTSATQALTIGGSNTTASITIGGALTSGAINLGVIGQSGVIILNSDVQVGTSSVNKGIVCNYLSNFQNSDLMQIAPILTTGSIRIGETQTSGNVLIGHTNPVTDSGTLTINKLVSLPANKTITLNSTGGAVLSPAFNSTSATQDLTIGGTSTSGDINIGSSQGLFGNITLGNSSPFFDFGSLYINKSTVIDTLKSLFCNSYQSISESSSAILFGQMTTGNITFGAGQTTGNITIGNATASSDSGTLTLNKNIVVATSKSLACDTFTGNNATTAISLFGTTTASNISLGAGQTSGNITLGHATPASDSGTLTLNKNIVVATGKSLTMSSTGNLITDNIRGTGISTSPSVFSTTTTGSVALCSAQTSGNITIGNTTPASDSGTLTINKRITLAQSKNITLGNLGYIYTNNLNCVGSGDTVSLFESTTTGFITIGNSMTGADMRIGNITAASDLGTLTINKNTTMGTGKDLLFSSTGRIRVDRIVGSTPLTSDINIGYTDTLYTATIQLNQNVNVASNRTLQSPIYNSTSATTLLEIGKTNTTANINIGASLTSGDVNISNVASTGLTTIGGKVRISKAATTREMWFNTGSGTTLFSSAALLNKQLSSNIYTGAPTEDFAVWEANALPTPGDASFIAQNGSATIICNPGDAVISTANYSLFWIDEDDMTTASNWTATNGWKITVTGAISALSDARTKHNIQTIDKAEILDKLENIDIVSFQKIRPPQVTRETKKYDCVHRGYTAQDLQANGFDEVVTADESGTLSVNYSDMNLYWFSGVQKLIKQNKEQQKQIDEQKLLIDNLTTRLARLEQILGI
jgi:hypothetical protein